MRPLISPRPAVAACLTLVVSLVAACSGSGSSQQELNPGRELEGGVKAMTNTIPRSREAAAALQQRSADGAAAANGLR